MHVDPKTGKLICNVCGDWWHDHAVGGNCKLPKVDLVPSKK